MPVQGRKCGYIKASAICVLCVCVRESVMCVHVSFMWYVGKTCHRKYGSDKLYGYIRINWQKAYKNCVCVHVFVAECVCVCVHV